MFDQEEIHRKCNSDDPEERKMSLDQLLNGFELLQDKEQAWEDLHRLMLDENIYVRHKAVRTLNTVFQYVPDKEKAWEDLIKLTLDEENDVRREAVRTLNTVFQYVPDKEKAWEDLIRLTSDKKSNRCVLINGFSDILTFREYSDVLRKLEEQLKIRPQYIQSEKHACKDKDYYVMWEATDKLGDLFFCASDKQKAWEDLHELTNSKNSVVKENIARALGIAFSVIPDKQKALEDLHGLAESKNKLIRRNANHSLGRAYIFRAAHSLSEEEYRKELECAIDYFEKASKESFWFDPSRFCYPFYSSYHSIVFEKQKDSNEKVDKYLSEAKKAIEGSKKKEILFRAVENLANALREVQKLENMDLQIMKEQLNIYRTYCEQASELMSESKRISPNATETIMKGLPVFDRSLKFLLKEIQEKAKTACQESKGSETEEIACSVKREVQNWGIGNPEEMTLCIENFISTLESRIPRFSENEHIFKMINDSRNQKDLKKLLEDTSKLIEIIPEIIIDPERMKPTIGIITALPKEYAAVNILLENKNDKYKISGSGAGRRYCLGEILSEEGYKHKLVMTNVGMGNTTAATRAAILLENFPNVRSLIMAGIAGGIPNPEKINDHVRLGDIVISNEQGVIQYDYIENKIEKVEYRNPPRPPSAGLMDAVRYLEAEEILGNRPWEKYIDQALSQLKIERPSEDNDALYSFGNQKRKIKHPEDPKRVRGQPRVFIGSIASANILQKNPMARDELRDRFKVKAIEMEASGIADATWTHEVGYLVVRGICDYCDSHKNDDWQQYAAVVAAAYTRALIESMP